MLQSQVEIPHDSNLTPDSANSSTNLVSVSVKTKKLVYNFQALIRYKALTRTT